MLLIDLAILDYIEKYALDIIIDSRNKAVEKWDSKISEKDISEFIEACLPSQTDK